MVDPGGSNKVVDRTDRTAVLAGEAGSETLVLTLEDALKIALSENVSVKVADKEVERVKYARKGTYASLFPQIDGSASYQRTIKKQVMYMDFDMGSLTGMAAGGETQTANAEAAAGNGSASGTSGSASGFDSAAGSHDERERCKR